MHPVGMQPDLKPPSKAQLHELRVLRLHVLPQSNRLPHVRDEGVELDVHAR